MCIRDSTKNDVPVSFLDPMNYFPIVRQSVMDRISFENVESRFAFRASFKESEDMIIYDGKHFFENPSVLKKLPECTNQNIIDKNLASNPQFREFFQAEPDVVNFIFIGTSKFVSEFQEYEITLHLLDPSTKSSLDLSLIHI
eukprot:TRINITY_DN7165_c0_g2_i2.p1 TRINITY_DN7165_c0_g2~~TRINITY_DN7165_c0_g2_i2.p1  ORF type:complete len:142 (+),score=20.29 TRINITY_DN7165_c0_g2_i2:63-488(+)